MVKLSLDTHYDVMRVLFLAKQNKTNKMGLFLRNTSICIPALVLTVISGHWLPHL